MYQILPKSKGNIIGLQVEGKMRAKDYDALLPHIDRLIEKHGKIRVLSDLRDYQGVELLAILRVLPYAFKYASRVEKKAVITDRHWMYTWTKILSPFFKTEARCFPSSEAEEAWKWVRK